MIVFVTGASAGFGAAIARAFVKGGHRVVATARRLDRLEALANELGPALLPIELDVRDRATVEALPGSLPADFANIDVLVNNAGLALGLDPEAAGAAESASFASAEVSEDGVLAGVGPTIESLSSTGRLSLSKTRCLGLAPGSLRTWRA